MEALLASITLVAVAEIGDKTQLLSFVLAAKLRRPYAIIAGIFVATLANHALAGSIGVWLAALVTPQALGWIVGLAFIGFGLWTLKPDSFEGPGHGAGAFLTTMVRFSWRRWATRHSSRPWRWRRVTTISPGSSSAPRSG